MGIITGTQVSLRYAVEATRGTSPGGNWKFLRATGRNINLKKDILESAEVNTTRQRSDVRHGFNRVEGDLGFEFSLNSHDEILAYTMGRPHVAMDPADNTQVALTGAGSYDGWLQSGKATGVGVSGTVLATATAPGTLTFTIGATPGTSTTTHWIDLGYRPGDWVVSAGFTDADYNSGGANPAQWKIQSIGGVNGGGDLVVQVPAGTIFTGVAAEAFGAGKSIEMTGRRVSIGTTLNTVSMERAFVDSTSSDTYQVFRGCAVNTLNMSIRPEAIVGGTFGFVGMSADIDNADTGAGTPTTIGTNSPFAAFDGSATLVNSAGAHMTAIVTGIDFTLDNQRTLFPVVGSKFSQDVYEGVAKVTGTVSLLLENVVHLTAFQNEAALNTITVRLNELGTTAFTSLVFCRVKYLGADMDPPQNGPVVVTCPFEALEQTFTGFASSQTDVRSKEVFRIQRSTTNIV